MRLAESVYPDDPDWPESPEERRYWEEEANPAMFDELPQHMIAFHKANRTRFARGATKRKIAGAPDRAASLRLAAKVVQHPPVWCETMPVRELLLSVHRVGEKAVGEMLAPEWSPSPGRKLVDLTERQRGRLMATLTQMAERAA